MSTTLKRRWVSLAGTPIRAARLWQRSGLCRKVMREPTKCAKEFNEGFRLVKPARGSTWTRRSKMQRVAVDDQIYMQLYPVT